MKSVLLITDSEAQERWLSLLKNNLPNEKILLPYQVSADQIEEVEIAVVANLDLTILDRFPNIVWIQSLWAGIEHLISEQQLGHVRIVRFIDPQMAKTMAEATLAWTLYLHRNMPEYAKQQAQRQWKVLPCPLAEELRIGVLGAGELGLAAANTLKKASYTVSCWSRTAKQLTGIKGYIGSNGLESMLAETDILINLLPLTPLTHHLLNQDMLSTLPEGARLINFSRGPIIDDKALLNLLDRGHLAHAVLDVFKQEPLPVESPFWQHPKVTVLPHISAPTNKLSAARIVADNITGYRESGAIPDFVDTNRGY